MDEINFRREIIKITSAALDKPFEEWITFNDSINTKIIEDPYPNLRIKLLENELPILECILDDSYLLVTTERIVANTNHSIDEVFIDSIENFTTKDDAVNYIRTNGVYPKIFRTTIVKKDGNSMVYFIDSYYPAYFATILIQNLRSYKMHKKWYINPRKKYQ